jgi:hypothetical protein
MPNPFQGYAPLNAMPPRFKAIRWSTLGFSFAHATESGELGLRKDATVTQKAVTVRAAGNRPITDSYDHEIKATGLQTRIADIKNAYLLSKAPHQLRLETAKATYYTYKQNTATVGTPDGSGLVGLSWKFTLTKTSRELEYTWSTNLFTPEHNWILENTTTADTGSASGSAIGLTAGAYGRDKYVRSNIVNVTNNAISVGDFREAKIEIETDVVKNWKNQSVGRFLKCKLEVTMSQAAAADLLAVSEAADNDRTVIFYTGNDEQFKFNTGAVVPYGEFVHSDSDATMKVIWEGDIPYNGDEGTPANIDLGVGSALIAEFELV